MESQSLINLLRSNLNERIALNSNYSLRAFARDLGISPQNLSNIINGRRGMSDEMAQRIATGLGLAGLEHTVFCTSAQALHSKKASRREEAKKTLRNLKAKTELKAVDLQIDFFKIISNWHHLALLELLKISKNHAPSILAQRLDIPENETKMALSRLERLELITKTGAKYAVNQDVIVADYRATTEAVRNFHRQMIQKSNVALESQTSSDRYGSSSVLPMKVKSLGRVKEMIQDFRTKLANEVTDASDGEAIFGLSIQFFKVSQ